jgi:hypothetical protein
MPAEVQRRQLLAKTQELITSGRRQALMPSRAGNALPAVVALLERVGYHDTL